VTGDEDGDAKTSEARAPAAARGRVTSGSAPYLTLAEIGYFCQVVVIAVDFVLLAATANLDYSGSIPSIAVEALLALVISVAWFQLGRKVGNSWFLVVAISGAVSWVLALAISFVPGMDLPDIFVIGETSAVVSLVYLVTGVGAFLSAARVFQVRLFRYAGYLLVAGFLVTFIVGVAVAVLTQPLCVPSSAVQSCTVRNDASIAGFGLGYLISAAMSLIAGTGFRRTRATISLSNPNREGW
jgi:hypothetical protein